MTKEDTYICNISKSPLSFTTEFVLNSFLHVTILFIFLIGLFIYIIVPLMVGLARDEIGHQIIDGIHAAIPAPINFNIGGKFNCDALNNQIKPKLIQQCLKQYSDSPIYSSDISKYSCDSMTDPLAKSICQKQKSNVIIKANESIDCNNYVDQVLSKNCTNTRELIDDYIKSTPVFSSFNISNADELYNSLYKILTSDENNVLNNYIIEYSKPNKILKLHNDSVINYGINISIILIIITATLFIVLKYACNKCINVKKILIENCITFTFIGGVEFWFFMTYASKFIPAPPSTLVSTAIDTVKTFLTLTPSYPVGHKIEYKK